MKKVKILLAMAALVAVVGVASVAQGATQAITTGATVNSTLALSAAGCATLNLASIGQNALDVTTTCTFDVTVNETYDLYVGDANDDAETCGVGAEGCIKATAEADQFDGPDTDPETPAAGTSLVGYWMSYAGTDTPTCAAATAVCAAKQTGNTQNVNAGTDVQAADSWTLGVAFATTTTQYADTYSDSWALTLAADV